jgi:hypothetical protein
MERTPTEADRSSSADRAIFADGYNEMSRREIMKIPHEPSHVRKFVNSFTRASG